jgi:SAM-dependent methyltransferase
MLDALTAPAMHARLAQLREQDPNFETLYYILGPERILEWAHSVGVASDHKLRDLAPEVPPHALRSIVAAPSESVFLWSGLKDAQMLATYLDRHVPDRRGRTVEVLDFGCGCGRTTRFLQDLPLTRVHGTDINQALVGWCQFHLPAVSTTLNGTEPSLAFGDRAFDFIYSLSIFTHLPEKVMQGWLVELARITADGGIVLLTTHGYPAIDTISNSPQHQQIFQLSGDGAAKLRSDFDRDGFVYHRYTPDVIDQANAGDDYGNSFTHEDYIRRHWHGDLFEVVEFVPGGMRGWQDLTILRRRARA